MKIVKAIFNSLTKREKLIFLAFLIIFAGSLFTRGVLAIYNNSKFVPVRGGDYAEGIVGQPNLINPVISNGSVDKDISALVYSSLDSLASRVEVDEGGRIYTITLRDDISWSDGTPITSSDVVFTLETIQDPEVNSPMADSWRGVVVERLSDVRLKFSLPSPYVFFEQNMSRLRVVPEHVFGAVPPSNIRLSQYNLDPISSGPYRVEDFKRRRDGFITEYHLVRNENYFKDSPYIEDFHFRFYENQRSLLNAFRKRNIDGFGLLSPPDPSIYELPRVEVVQADMPRYYSIFFNPKATSMLSNEDFRNALNLAIDKSKLVEEVIHGEGQVVDGPYGANLSGIDNDYAGPDKDEARSLINEIKSSEDVEEVTIQITIPDVEFIRETAKFVKKEWESVGVDSVSIQALNLDDFSGTVLRERNYEAVIFGNVLENPMDLFPFWHSSERFYPGLNLSFYSNDDVDSYLENVRQQEDISQRRQEFRRIVDVIKSDVPASFLYSIPYTYVHNEKLHGVGMANKRFVVPSDRFEDVESWYVKRARVIE